MSGPSGLALFSLRPRVLLAVAGLIAAGIVAYDSLQNMTAYWERAEYNHSYLIPFVATFLLWQRLPALAHVPERAWAGTFLVVVAFAVMLIGELSALFTIVQYGFIALLIGLFISAFGPNALKWAWAPLAYLFFMVPLPNFLYNNLSQSLQLISSEIGVAVIRLFGISVYLEGNVIDLGAYQLQVVEACSGLRYLFPLMSFGFLVAYLYKGPTWQRLVIFFSTIPITVLMNSVRIGIIGVLVDRWGTGMAEGFLHLFEGWVIFIACLAVLFAEVWLLNRLSGSGIAAIDRLDLSMPSVAEVKAAAAKAPPRSSAPLIVSAVSLIVLSALTFGIESRAEVIPDRQPLIAFPLYQEQWQGREGYVEAPIIESLKLTDYLIADYRHPEYPMPVNLYVAYYESQRKGASVHSPRSCIPGGGWVIEDHTVTTVESTPVASLAEPLPVNRVVIAKGSARQLVYYWFQQRGRLMTNEYLVKWFLFWDALTKNRTDGALVRLVVPLPDGYPMERAEAELRAFIGDFQGTLRRHIPGQLERS